jgi:uncharacterized membrane protein HdeD (DUF308 family)
MATQAFSIGQDRRRHRCSVWLALRGLLALALGLLSLPYPESALYAFTTVFAAFALADGLVSLGAGIVGTARQGERWGALIPRGLVGIAIGLLFVFLPLYTTLGYALLMVLMVAAWAIVTGLLEIAAALRLGGAIAGRWLLGASGLLSLLLGAAILAMLLFFPAATLLSLAWIIGIYAIAAGIALLTQALRRWGARA